MSFLVMLAHAHASAVQLPPGAPWLRPLRHGTLSVAKALVDLHQSSLNEGDVICMRYLMAVVVPAFVWHSVTAPLLVISRSTPAAAW